MMASVTFPDHTEVPSPCNGEELPMDTSLNPHDQSRWCLGCETRMEWCRLYQWSSTQISSQCW